MACNLVCDPRHENKVLVPILFFYRRVPFRPLVQRTCNPDVTLCMVTKFMNKWMFTSCKYNYFPFHCVPWGEFHTALRVHHLSAGLLRAKLKEFRYLEQGNHGVFDYKRQFNTLAQYGSFHIDTDEKKANLYRAGLTIHLQECLIQFASLSYNELVSSAIDQERMMKVVAEDDEKKMKK
jgi:hypothetical protein